MTERVEVRDHGSDGGVNGLTVSNITCGQGDILICLYMAKDSSVSPATPSRNGNSLSLVQSLRSDGQYYTKVYVDIAPDVGTYDGVVGGTMNVNRIWFGSISGASGYSYTHDADASASEVFSIATSPLGITIAMMAHHGDGTVGGITGDTTYLTSASGSLGRTQVKGSNGTGSSVSHTNSADGSEVLVWSFYPASSGGMPVMY